METEGQGGKHVRYLTREVGIYLVIETNNGIILIWDRKTTIFIKVSPAYKVRLYSVLNVKIFVKDIF